MSDSLNAGNELDGELKNEDLFADIVPGEVPDLNEDTKLIAVLESQLDDLIDLGRDVHRAGGMSQSFALEAERILPNCLSEKNPNYYSQAVSATRYKVAMEEISRGVWALIAAASLAVVGLIVKIYNWLAGDKNGDGTSKAAIAKVEAKIEAVKEGQESLRDTAEVLKEVDSHLRHTQIVLKDKDGNEVRYTKMDEVIAELFTDDAHFGTARKFLTEPKPVHVDIVNFGPYSKTIDEVAKAGIMHGLYDLMKLKMAALKEVQDNDMRAEGFVAVELHSNLARAVAPAMVRFRGKEMTLDELNDILTTARRGAESTPAKLNISFDHLFNSILAASKKTYMLELLTGIIHLMPELDKMKKECEKIGKDAGDVGSAGGPGANTEDIAVGLRKAVPSIGTDLARLANFMHQIDMYIHEFNYLVREVDGFTKDIVRKITRALELSGDKVPDEWKELLKKTENLRGALGKNGLIRA